MAADAQILRHYDDTTMKADVLSLIEYLTAEDSSIHNMLGKTKAIATVHEVMDDTLLTAASGAVAEVEDYTMGTLTTPSRRVNLIENVAMPFSVSRTQQIIDHYHNENELVRQTTKGLKQWHNSAEFDIVRSTLVSGVSGTAPKMSYYLKSLINYLTGHLKSLLNNGNTYGAALSYGNPRQV